LKLKDKVVLITDGASASGLAIAERFKTEGAILEDCGYEVFNQALRINVKSALVKFHQGSTPNPSLRKVKPISIRFFRASPIFFPSGLPGRAARLPSAPLSREGFNTHLALWGGFVPDKKFLLRFYKFRLKIIYLICIFLGGKE